MKKYKGVFQNRQLCSGSGEITFKQDKIHVKTKYQNMTS